MAKGKYRNVTVKSGPQKNAVYRVKEVKVEQPVQSAPSRQIDVWAVVAICFGASLVAGIVQGGMTETQQWLAAIWPIAIGMGRLVRQNG